MLGSEGQKLLLEAKRTNPEHLPVYNEQQVRIVSREIRQLWEQIEAITTQLPEAALASQHADNNNGGGFSSSPAPSHIMSQPFSTSSQIPASDLTQQQQAINNNNNPSDEMASYGADLLLYQLGIHNNKRTLMAYHHRRLEYLVPLLWSFHGSVSLIPPQARDRMSHSERTFIDTYAKNLQSYQSEFESAYGDYDIDLELTLNIEHPPKDLFIEVRVVQDCGEVQTEFGMVNLEKGSQHYLRRTDVEHLIAQGYLKHVS